LSACAATCSCEWRDEEDEDAVERDDDDREAELLRDGVEWTAARELPRAGEREGVACGVGRAGAP
jgi:hypothetical protein